MSLISKIILSISTFLLFSFLFLFTFILKNDSLIEELNFEKIENGIFKLSNDGENHFSKEKINILENDSVILNNITTNSRFFSVNGNYSEINSQDKIIINIEPGIYLFETNEIDDKIIIESNGYKIKNLGTGTFFINNTNPKKTLIYSLDTITNIEILDYKTNEVLNLIPLYPHSYFSFNPTRNHLIKNGDSLKISQVLNLQFFNEKVFGENYEINENFLTLFSGKNEKDKIFIKDILLYLKNDYLKNSENSKIDLYIFPGENYIKTYFYLFFNNEKKKLYYKNLILKNALILNNSEKIEQDKINFINNTILKLEEIDKTEANNIKDIINYFYVRKVRSNNNSLNNNINFLKLVLKVNNKKDNNFHSLILLKNIFKNYDFDFDYSLFEDIGIFRSKYFEDIGIEKNNNSNKDLIQKEIDYLLFFLENIINSNFSNEEEYINNIIFLFGDYVELLSNFTNNNSTNNRTLIYKTNIILENLGKRIRNIYFEEQRNEDKLLERKKTIDNESLKILNNGIKKLDDFINPLLGTINNNNTLLTDYEKNIYNFNEYLTALEDLDKYTKKYNVNVNKLIGSNSSIVDTDVKYIDTKEKLKSYLSKFNGTSLNNLNIQEKDYNYCKNNIDDSKNNIDDSKNNGNNFTMYCFKVENFEVTNNFDYSSKSLSFIFFPYEYNKIEIIININGNDVKRKYNLNSIESGLKEKLDGTSDPDELIKYDFKNFFINTFVSSQKNNNQNLNEIEEKNKLEEEKYIRSFKGNLLSEYGDFSILKGLFTVNYNDLIVTKNNEDYLIKIINSLIKVSVKDGTNIKVYNAYLKGNYIFEDLHSFENISLKIFEIEENGETKYTFLDNFININGIIAIKEFENEINKLFSQIKDLKNVFTTIRNILYLNTYEINYEIEKNYFQIKTLYKNKDLNIILQSGNIKNVNYDGNDIIVEPISINNLNITLNSIKQ